MTLYVLAWFPMLGLAILNGAIREKVYATRMTELAAHQASCLTGIGMFTIYTAILNRMVPFVSAEQAIRVGVLWLIMTICFEVCMICLIMKRPLSFALAQYDIRAGKLWPFVLLAVAALPWLAFRFLG